MSVRDALFEACRLAPDEDEPRLVWADAVGGERGELVVIQCDLARGGLAPAEVAARRRRERELLEAHGAAWTGLAGVVPGLGRGWDGFEFRRGFVEAVTLQARAFVEHGAAIWQRLPFLRALTATGLRVTSDQLEELHALLASPAFRPLRGLYLWQHDLQPPPDAPGHRHRIESHGDRAARLLVESGALAHLRELGIGSSRLTAAGVNRLVASGELGRLERLELGVPEAGGDAIAALLVSTPCLEGLRLAGAAELEPLASVLPPLRELSLTGLTDQTLAALGRSRAAATIETLALANARLERGADFQAFPRLRGLAFTNEWLGELDHLDAVLRGLAVAAPQSLRRLCLAGWYLSAAALRVAARALGPRLEELDLRDSLVDDLGVIEELRACVAGEVRVSYSSAPED